MFSKGESQRHRFSHSDPRAPVSPSCHSISDPQRPPLPQPRSTAVLSAEEVALCPEVLASRTRNPCWTSSGSTRSKSGIKPSRFSTRSGSTRSYTRIRIYPARSSSTCHFASSNYSPVSSNSALYSAGSSSPLSSSTWCTTCSPEGTVTLTCTRARA